MVKILDFLQIILVALIALIIFTGGVWFESNRLKLELSQVDAFAWALFLVSATRRVRTGLLLGPSAQRLV